MRTILGVVLSLAIPAAAFPQAPPPARFDPAAATEYADSFVTLVRGQPAGWHRYELRRTSSGFAYAESFVVTQLMEHRVSVSLDQSLAVLRAADEGNFMGTASGSDLAYEGQHARGTVRARRPDGVRTLAIDTVFAPGTINGLALLALLPTLDWGPGAAYAIDTYDHDQLSVATQLLRVMTEEQVTVPAGTFDVFKAELSARGRKMYLWYTRAVPHRLVRLATDDESIVDVLIQRNP